MKLVRQTKFFRIFLAVDHNPAAILKPLGDVWITREILIEDDQMVGVPNRAAQRNLPVVDSGIGRHGRPSPFGSKRGKGLNPFSLFEEGRGHDLGSYDRSLATSPVNPDLNHRSPSIPEGRSVVPFDQE